ncbi:2-phosphosulfolactate phosphatase [Bacillus sp. JJ1533]|uniref:2-phosphosulfolactate phosphatase n=1 Tax=Bacillus sp. JJ1533 TaxID=3122959 RepID=UPI002FFDC11D
MRKINVITQKELINPDLIRNCTAVVVDVFLATSTIITLLEQQYEPIYPVKDYKTALEIAKLQVTPFLLMGEANGKEIENFDYPDPTFLKKTAYKKTAVICSTNGTIAVHKAKHAKVLYASSLLNGHHVANKISQQEDDSSIVIICSGNAGRFSLEDFIGAGHIIDYLVYKGEYTLSDSAMLARESFIHSKLNNFNNLFSCETAEFLKFKGYEHTIQWVINNFEKMITVPIFQGDYFVHKS